MRKVFGAIIAIVIVLGGVLWYIGRDLELSEIPPNSASDDSPATSNSLIAVNVRLPYKAIAAQAEQTAPSNYSDRGNGPDQCARHLGIRICVGTKFEFSVSRGPIVVGQGASNAIRITVPFNISGRGGFRGDGAGLLDLDAKNFRARVEAYADVGLSLKPDWCPKTEVKADFRWIEGARVEIIGDVWIGISNLVEARLRKQVQKMGNDAAASITCDKFRREVEKVWITRSFPVEIPGAQRPLYINFEPVDFGFSGLHTSSGDAKVALILTAKAGLETKPIVERSLTLPQVQVITPGASSLNLVIPIRLSYSDLEGRLSNLLFDKPILTDTPAGVSTATVRKLKIYPSGKRVVIGALVDIDLPNRWLDVSGWVYLMARPIPVNEGTALRLSQLAFTRALDNKLWEALSIVLESTLKRELTRIGTFDLTSSIQEAKNGIAEQLAKPNNEVVISIGDPIIKIRRFAASHSELFAEVTFNSMANITLTSN